MLTTMPIRKKFGRNICLDCINQVYKVKLSRRDCRYSSSEECPCCHVQHHPVVGFRASGLAKMILRF